MRKTKYDWNVDWTKQDVVIASLLGCTRERVRQKRVELGKDPSLYHHQHSLHPVLDRLIAMDTSTKTLHEIANEINCNVVYVRKIFKRHNKSFIVKDGRRRSKYDWEKADWTKTDKETAFELSVPNVATVTQHRLRLGIFKKKQTVKFEKEKNLIEIKETEKVNI